MENFSPELVNVLDPDYQLSLLNIFKEIKVINKYNDLSQSILYTVISALRDAMVNQTEVDFAKSVIADSISTGVEKNLGLNPKREAVDLKSLILQGLDNIKNFPPSNTVEELKAKIQSLPDIDIRSVEDRIKEMLPENGKIKIIHLTRTGIDLRQRKEGKGNIDNRVRIPLYPHDTHQHKYQPDGSVITRTKTEDGTVGKIDNPQGPAVVRNNEENLYFLDGQKMNAQDWKNDNRVQSRNLYTM